MPKYIRPKSYINNITCGNKTCISAMLLQSHLNKCRLLQLTKLDKLCLSSTSTRTSKISNIYFVE